MSSGCSSWIGSSVSSVVLVCCGGIAEKNDLFMQIYADVIGQPMLIAGSPQTPALGSAVSAAVTAGAHAGGYDSWTDAQDRMTSLKAKRFEPRNKAMRHQNRQMNGRASR